MIKVDKNLANIPTSLLPAIDAVFPPPNKAPITSTTTHKRRIELIDQQKYIRENIYDSRYKLDDIKVALKAIYNGKCAFCEQRIELFHVEHYRPKDIYYWLAYSWDNLLVACPNCNTHKSTNFALDGIKAQFVKTDPNIEGINTSSSLLDITEKPLLVNPEVTDPKGKITFTKDGSIDSTDPRFKYTITTCKIDRKHLNDDRRAIINDFKRDIRSALISNATKEQQLTGINTIIRNFISDAKDVTKSYLAMRIYAFENGWLQELIKEIKAGA